MPSREYYRGLERQTDFFMGGCLAIPLWLFMWFGLIGWALSTIWDLLT